MGSSQFYLYRVIGARFHSAVVHVDVIQAGEATPNDERLLISLLTLGHVIIHE